MVTINTSAQFTAPALVAALPEGTSVIGDTTLFEEPESKAVTATDVTAAQLRAAVAQASAGRVQAAAAADARAKARLRVRELHSKGWQNLSAVEKAEVPQHLLTLLAE